MSATDAFSPALARTKAQLFRPFRWATWSRIALLGLATGEFGSGSCNIGGNNSGGASTSHTTDSFAALPQWWHNVPMGAIVAIALLAFVLILVMLYVNSVARFMLFDTVLTGRASLREQWSRWHAQGVNYFGFQLIMAAVVLGVLLIVIGVPLLIAKNIGVLAAPRDHLALALLGGFALVMVFLLVVLIATIITVLGKDFIVPQMALEQIDFVEAWRRYWRMLKAEKGGYAGYLGLKALMRIAAIIIFGIISFILILILLLPIVVVVLIPAGISGAAGGLTWTPLTVALAAVVGTVLLTVLMFLIGFIHSPVTVFFPSYALHFFGSRYQPLYDRMYPPHIPPSAPEPPPIAPEPTAM